MWWVLVALAGVPEVELEALADQAWSQGPGRAMEARTHAADRVARRLPVGPSGLVVDAQVGVASQRQLLLRVEQPLGLGLATHSLHRALKESQRAETEEARWTWTLSVHDAWFAWWNAKELRIHLEAHAASLEADAAARSAAVRDGLLAPADQADLIAETLMVQTDLAQSRRDEATHESLLRARIGEGPWPEGPPLENHEQPEVNPWAELVDQAASFPEVVAETRRSETEAKHATALRSSALPIAGVGVMWAPDDDGTLRPFANLALTVPLQTGLGAERQRARGEAAAAAMDASWSQHTLRSALEEELIRWDGMRQEHQRLSDQVLGLLQEREARLADALGEGLVPIERVIRARRERHEAEHHALLLAGALHQSTSRAALLFHLLEVP